jgi:type IV secretion system protein VirB9
MRVLILAVSAACLAPALALAKPASDWKAKTETASEQIDPLGGRDVPLSRKARRGLKYGRQWDRNRVRPARGADGSTVFTFGATMPVVVCAPLYVCDLMLQAGESVNDLNIGDKVRWRISPATQGTGETAVTHLIIKPSDIGLTTNMVITTNRRAYTIKLVSRRKDWMPRVSFDYPDDVSAEWGVYRRRQKVAREAQEVAVARDVSHPDFSYRISGDDPPWQPVRVYAAGGKTYIQFPKDIAHGDLPALVALADDGGLFTEPTKELVNYRYARGAFVVDKVLERAALISGVGSDQIVVRIEHQGRR